MARIIDWEKVGQMFIAGSNIKEAAACLDMCRVTLYDRCLQDNGRSLSEFYEEHRDKGNATLHIAQYHKALRERNPTMLIWLGKQRLGQRDNIDTVATNDKELSRALVSIHSFDVDNMIIKIDLLEQELLEYRKGSQKEPVQVEFLEVLND